MANWKDEKFWISKYNFDEDLVSSRNIPAKVEIHDSTLRDGEQTPGVIFSVDQKVEIAHLLDKLGVERIEAGMPAVSAADYEAIKQITSSDIKANVYVFARGMKDDIDAAKECGAKGVVIELPTSEVKLKYQFAKWTEDTLIQKAVDTCSYAKQVGLETIFFGYDTFRADMGLLDRLYSTLAEVSHPDAIGLVDTVGCALPSAVGAMTRKILGKYGIPIQIHTHNDFGMATASSFAAIENGANVIHTCINGLGERTGNASTEQIMMGMKLLYGLDNDYNLGAIQDVCLKVADMAHRPIPYNAAFVGKNSYSRESGMGIEFVKRNPVVMFSIDPSLVGNSGVIIIGKGSGAKSVLAKCEELGIECKMNDEQMHAMVAEIKALALKKQAVLSDEEFLSILKEYQA